MQGSSFTSYGRLLKPQYDDKVHSVRKSVRGYNLPSARNIVRKLFLDDKVNLNKFKDLKNVPNVGALMFGQYVAHDVGSKQPIQYVDGGNGEKIKFCDSPYSHGFVFSRNSMLLVKKSHPFTEITHTFFLSANNDLKK